MTGLDRSLQFWTVSIHRVGPNPAPYRQDLGRVLVTIDDLQALLNHVQQSLPAGTSLQVQFDGGYFTDSNDIRTLTDDELRSLRIQAPDVQVHLSEHEVLALGDETKAKAVYLQWARSRQVSYAGLTFLRKLASGLASVGIAIIILGGIAILGLERRGVYPNLEEVATMPAIILSVVLLVLYLTIALLDRTLRRKALIKPFSMSEYRSMQHNNKYPRASWIVAVVAVIVAIVAIIAPLIWGN
jgi:hypothetical protein